MKLIWVNLVSILLIFLAGFMIYLDRTGWGWCIFGAIICCTSSYTVYNKKSNSDD
jgi:hypothetical protein